MARGGVVIRGATAGAYELTGTGTAGQVLTSNGAGADPTFQAPSGGTPYTDEEAQDAVGGILVDTATIDLTYADATPSITADVKASSIAESHQVLADNTTHDVSTTKHGYVPKATGDTQKFLRADGTWAYDNVGHAHGLQRMLGDGSTTTFNLLDIAEYLEHIGVNGSFSDPATFTLSSDGSQVTFDAAPGAGQVVTMEYVIAGI